jgi:WS/DGAT/MGAT family acyltransferase
MSRRLSATDAAFLYLETASAPMHIASIYVLDGELAFEKVLEHFESRIHLIPAFRQRLAQVPFNLAHPVWVDDPEFDLRNHVKHLQLPEGATLEDGIDAATELNEPMLDRRRPLWRFHVINGVPGKTLILHQNHHATIDGLGAIELSTILYDLDPEFEQPPPVDLWQPEPVPGPMQRISDAVREHFDAAREKGGSRLLGDAGKRHLVSKAFGVIGRFLTRPVITAPFNAGPVGPKRRARYVKHSLAEIREIRRALGGTVNDVVLAVVSDAVARYLELHDERTDDGYLRIMCPVNLRAEDEAGTPGNLVTAVFTELPAWPMTPVQRLIAVRAEMERITHGEDAQALTVLADLASSIWPVPLAPAQLVGTPWDPTAFTARMPRPEWPGSRWRPPNFGFNFVCTNIPGIQEPQYLVGHKVTATIGLLVLALNVGFSVTVMSHNKEVFISFICDPTLLPDLEAMVEAAETSFGELLGTAREHARQLSV